MWFGIVIEFGVVCCAAFHYYNKTLEINNKKRKCFFWYTVSDGPAAIGLWQIKEHMVEQSVYLMATRKQRERKGLGSKHTLQGHTHSNLTSSH